MATTLQRAAVIGAGNIGAAIAAHLANAGVPVLLLDRTNANGGERSAGAAQAVTRQLENGGLGTFAGPVIGAAVAVSLHSYLAAIGARSTVVIGLVFMTSVLTFRRGVVGEWLALQRKRPDA